MLGGGDGGGGGGGGGVCSLALAEQYTLISHVRAVGCARGGEDCRVGGWWVVVWGVQGVWCWAGGVRAGECTGIDERLCSRYAPHLCVLRSVGKV